MRERASLLKPLPTTIPQSCRVPGGEAFRPDVFRNVRERASRLKPRLQKSKDRVSAIACDDAIHTLNEGGGIGELRAAGNLRLLEQQQCQIGAEHRIGFRSGTLDQRMLGIDLKRRRGFGQLLTRIAEQPGKMRRHVVIGQHQARGRIGHRRDVP